MLSFSPMKNNKKPWIWVIIALAFLVSIGGLAYWLTKPKKAQYNQPTTNNQSQIQHLQTQLNQIKQTFPKLAN